ncbi:neutral zinc metallopeptidase [Planctomycetes bacterium Poly30]
MQWKGRRKSENVVDAGGDASAAPRGKQAAVGGGLGVIVLAVIMLLMGKNPLALLSQLPTQAAGPQTQQRGGDGVVANSPAEQEMLDMISVVLASTEDVWNDLFRQGGQKYQEPTLVRFRDMVSSACGTQSSAVGPFYCSGDDTIYLDLTFFSELAKRHSAAGDFAQAYVIAHEVGHHLQNLLGITQMVAQKKQGLSEARANQWSVRQELHADFLAGVWAYYAKEEQKMLDPGDREEALNAAKQIGDDTLQRKARGYVQPEGFTHGTAAQRQRWFKLGMDTGDMRAGERVYDMPYEDL